MDEKEPAVEGDRRTHEHKEEPMQPQSLEQTRCVPGTDSEAPVRLEGRRGRERKRECSRRETRQQIAVSSP